MFFWFVFLRTKPLWRGLIWIGNIKDLIWRMLFPFKVDHLSKGRKSYTTPPGSKICLTGNRSTFKGATLSGLFCLPSEKKKEREGSKFFLLEYSTFNKALACWNANGKSQKLFPLWNNGENLPCVPNILNWNFWSFYNCLIIRNKDVQFLKFLTHVNRHFAKSTPSKDQNITFWQNILF